MFNANFHHSHQSVRPRVWHQPKLQFKNVPPQLRQSMRIKGSLTQYIQHNTQQRLQVTIIRQAWQKPMFYESDALQLAPRRVAWVREVVLSIDGQPWAYARSVIPQQALKGRWAILKHLNQRPLGTLLFQRQRCHRGVIKVGHVPLPLSEELLEKYFATQVKNNKQHARVWARYSAFVKRYQLNKRQRTKKMLVSEYFLDAFMRDYF